MLRWPDHAAAEQALRRWTEQAVRAREGILRIGYFGSYARGDWGVGSDLDLVIVVEGSEEPFERRPAQWDTTALPVPTDVLVYTRAEWALLPPDRRFSRALREETIWLYERPSSSLPSSS